MLKRIHARSMYQWNTDVPTHAQSHRGTFPTCQRLGCLLALRRFHHCRKNDDVYDGLDEADGHADVGDPGDDDGGDLDRGGGLPDPESDDDESEEAEPNADDHESPWDEPSQSCVSDRVKDRRMNQQTTRQAPNTNHTGRCHIRPMRDDQKSLSDIQGRVEETLVDSSEVA
ncbi:hypothetical protein MMC29_006180 [Sticta canariensis]|nr:hypothetical protein [Sticta canariensis]